MKSLLVLLADAFTLKTPGGDSLSIKASNVDAEELPKPTGSPGMLAGPKRFVKMVIMFVQEIPEKQTPFSHICLSASHETDSTEPSGKEQRKLMQSPCRLRSALRDGLHV